MGWRWKPNSRFIFNSFRAKKHTSHDSHVSAFHILSIAIANLTIVVNSALIELISNINLKFDNSFKLQIVFQLPVCTMNKGESLSTRLKYIIVVTATIEGELTTNIVSTDYGIFIMSLSTHERRAIFLQGEGNVAYNFSFCLSNADTIRWTSRPRVEDLIS